MGIHLFKTYMFVGKILHIQLKISCFNFYYIVQETIRLIIKAIILFTASIFISLELLKSYF